MAIEHLHTGGSRKGNLVTQQMLNKRINKRGELPDIIAGYIRWASLCILLAPPASAALPTFTSSVELRRLDGTPAGSSDVNISQIDPVSAGYGATGNDGGSVPVRWAADGMPTQLARPAEPSFRMYANGINNAGQVAGTLSPGGPVRWEADRSPTLLVGPYRYSGAAYGINNAGQAVGEASDLNLRDRAARWEADGSAMLLGEVPGQIASMAYGISDTGFVAGYADLSGGRFAVRWAPDGSATVLGLGSALSINNLGQAVGGGPIRWEADGSATGLGDLPGHLIGVTQAWGITNNGLVGGYEYLADTGFNRAVIWDADGTPSMLQDLVADGNAWTFTEIDGIDADATMLRVLAVGSKNGGPFNFYFVDASIPEPTTLVLLALGLPVLLCRPLLRKTERRIP
jgi:hypothetical protein